MNALTKSDAQPAPVTSGGLALVPQNLSEAMKLAEFMSRAKMVPTHLSNAADMLMIIEQAMRWGMSPFAVAQCTGIVKGKMFYEGKLVAAAVHTSGILSGRLNYEFSGSGDNREVRAFGVLRGETAPRDVVVTLKSARTDNDHWRKSPDQMLTYHAARVWARRHAPEVMLGVYAPEEFDAPEQRDTFSGTTIEAERQTVNSAQSARDINDSIPALDDQPAPVVTPRTWSDILREIKAKADAIQTHSEYLELERDDDVLSVWNNAGPKANEVLADILRTASERMTAPPSDALGMPEASEAV